MEKKCSNCSRYSVEADSLCDRLVTVCRLKRAVVPACYVCDEWYPSIWLMLKVGYDEWQKQTNKKS